MSDSGILLSANSWIKLAIVEIARLLSGGMSCNVRQRGTQPFRWRSTHVVLVRIDAFSVKSLAALALVLPCACCHPDIAVQTKNDIHACWAAWWREVVEVRLESPDQPRRKAQQQAIPQLQESDSRSLSDGI